MLKKKEIIKKVMIAGFDEAKFEKIKAPLLKRAYEAESKEHKDDKEIFGIINENILVKCTPEIYNIKRVEKKKKKIKNLGFPPLDAPAVSILKDN